MHIFKTGFIAAVALVSFLLSSALFVVDERERALLLRFGEIVRSDYEPGIHLKVPFINNVILFDKRIQTLDAPPERYLTLEKKHVNVDLFLKWRIEDVRAFYIATSGNVDRAANLLSPIVKRLLLDAIANRTMQQVISGDRKEVMRLITEATNQGAREFGIEVLDLRIKRVDLPDEVSGAVYRRMEAERERIAKELRSEGQEESEKIRAEADRRRVVLLAEAYREAEKIRGEGDGAAAKLYAHTYSKDADFYRFYRSLNAYRTAFQSKDDVLVLDAQSSFFDHFRDQP